MEHFTEIAGLSPEELARRVADLRYDALECFLFALTDRLEIDAHADEKRGRAKLASALTDACFAVNLAARAVARAWTICAPRMKDSV
jgi:hypothetical protein